ncbi:MAG: ester cyclase [Burkholderiales bacterium]|nr:ester cyclase [Burkholderiales bacterium]
MKGFDAEFRDVDHYIRAITDRIWTDGRIDAIARYYDPECVVETPTTTLRGADAVADSTRATLATFPDRRLLAEDVIVSGDADNGFHSSHRILSPMTHAGAGPFGAATGRPVHVRTVADCVVRNNRIVHEWLVRDQAAIARQIGREPRALAQAWLDSTPDAVRPAPTQAPAPYRNHVCNDGVAQEHAAAFRETWEGAGPQALAATHSREVIAALPGGSAASGREALLAYWDAMRSALPDARLNVEHLVAAPRPGKTALAMRWRLAAHHAGSGRFGPATHRRVDILGITHAEAGPRGIEREWILIDEIAIWMQLLEPSGAPVRREVPFFSTTMEETP